jgi:hypothetical protein
MAKTNNPPLRFTKMPILLSALVYPGIGQFVQRRWLWGLAYMGSFTAISGVTALIAFRYFKIEFKDLTYFQTDWVTHRADNPYTHTLLKALALCIAIFVANIFDAWMGYAKWKRSLPPAPAPVP